MRRSFHVFRRITVVFTRPHMPCYRRTIWGWIASAGVVSVVYLKPRHKWRWDR